MIRVAIVGAGAIAVREHIPCFSKNAEVKIESIVEKEPRTAKSVAKRFGIEKTYATTSELFDSSDVDAISICTPPDSHAAIAVEALERNVHVLCEKPLSDSLKNALSIVGAASESKACFMMGFNRRFNPSYVRTKERIANGEAGLPYLVEYSSLQGSPLSGWTKSPWHYDKEVGGCIRDQGPHVFDILNWFLGTPSAVSCYSSTLSDTIDECCVATVEYERNDLGVGTMGWLAPLKIEKLAVHGTGRSYYAFPPDFVLDVNGTDLPEVSLWKASTAVLLGKTKRFFSGNDLRTYQMEVDHFIECIVKGIQPEADLKAGLSALAVMEAAFESLNSGSRVNVNVPNITRLEI